MNDGYLTSQGPERLDFCYDAHGLCMRPSARIIKIEGTVKRADRRRMVELREETGVQRSLIERLVRSRLQWAGLTCRKDVG